MNTQRSTVLIPVKDEPKKIAEWAIDEPYKKPKLVKPHFEEHPDVKLRKQGKHPSQLSPLKKRFAELIKPVKKRENKS